ncbi:zinc finger CCCH domain-containing protein 13-like isoform X4 [Mytilus californianus]|uniref:zinc finger CCCH domain-containing protein 13-like isoform X4 n=1 Tax=Mytilus californianus TaxID=6549 RepID=UPI0022450286|nr:zinc finger CCCH domain-containing protein 13-like isoform X4 [Mytilus californianus]
MSKLKRRVTVDNQQSTQDESDRRKPSVFERLGPGAAGASRKYDESICRNFLAGKCYYGIKCKFKHVKRRQERDEDSSSDEFSKIVRKSRRDSERSEGEEEMKGSKKLDFKKELELEKKRQQIERELQQLGGLEERENITIEKKMSSSDDSSDERPQTKKKKSPSKKKDKKKHKVKSPSKVKQVTPSPEKKVKKFEQEIEKEVAQKKKHKKKKALEKKMAEMSEEEAKPKKSKLKGMKSKAAEQKPRLSFQSEEEEDTIIVKKRQRTPSESPSRSHSRSRSWSQDMSRQHSPDERYERSQSPVHRKFKKGIKDIDELRQSLSPESHPQDHRGRSSSFESPEGQMGRKKGKRDTKKSKHKHEPQYQSGSDESDYSRERVKGDKGKKHKKGREWSPESRETLSRDQRKSSPGDYSDYKSKKERDKHSPGFRDRRRSASPVSRHSHVDSRRDMSPGSQRSGSMYHRERRITPPPDRREIEEKYDRRDRVKDDPRRGGRFTSPDDRRYRNADRPDLDRGADRYEDRREVHDDRFPPRVEPPRTRFEERYFEQSGRTESFDRDRDRFERDRYNSRIDSRGHPPRADHRDRGDPRLDPRVEPRYPEAAVYDDRGPPPPEYRDPAWDRWNAPGHPPPPVEPYNRGGYNKGDRYRGAHRGGRFDVPPPLPPPERPSRRGEWERGGEEFYVPDRPDWGDRREGHRDFSREVDRRNNRPDDRSVDRYDRSDRRNDNRDRSRDQRDRFADIHRPDPREGSMDKPDRRESESFKRREFSADRGRDLDKEGPRKDRKISEPRDFDRQDKKESIEREKEKKEITEKVIDIKEKEKVEKVKETEDKDGKKEKEKGDLKKNEKEKKKRTKAEKKARKEEKLKAKQKKLEDKLAKEKIKSEIKKEPIIKEEEIKKEPEEPVGNEEKKETRKRILSEDRSKSLSPSPTSKRARDSSPAVSVKSRHSVGTIERVKVKEEPEVNNEKSKSRSMELEKDNMSEKSHGSERRPERKQKETSPVPHVPVEEVKEQKKKKRSRSTSGEEEFKRRRTEERDRVRKLRGSVDEEGGRYSSFSDDSADVILKQGEPQQTGSAIPEHVYREGGRRRRSRSRSSYGSKHSHHDSKGRRSDGSRYRDRRSRSRSPQRSGERERRSRGDSDRDRERDRGRERDREKEQTRPRSESDSRGPREESDSRGPREEPTSSKIDVKTEEIKSEVKDESGGESEDDLSLSSISSDEEFEADHEKKHSIDALDIDWASLQQDVRPKPPVTGSALNRFKASNVFAQIGVSKEYAGEELFNKIQNECIKQEDSTDVATTEEKTEDVKPDNKFRFKSDIAVFHSSITSKNLQRKNLLRNIGPFRRALCARRDLEIRRQLCKVDKTMDHIHSYPAQPIDQELYKLSVQLFRQSCPEKPVQIKQEVTSS